MKNTIKKQIHLSELAQGMTVEFKGEMLTVSKNDIKYDKFLGYSFRGDASKKFITLVQFKVPTAFGFALR